MTEELLKFSIEGDCIVSRLDLKEYAQYLKDAENFIVKKPERFKAYLQKRINDGSILDLYYGTGDEETGNSMWARAFCEIVEEAYEGGEDWVEWSECDEGEDQ
jgi:hypothetical protein